MSKPSSKLHSVHLCATTMIHPVLSAEVMAPDLLAGGKGSILGVPCFGIFGKPHMQAGCQSQRSVNVWTVSHARSPTRSFAHGAVPPLLPAQRAPRAPHGRVGASKGFGFFRVLFRVFWGFWVFFWEGGFGVFGVLRGFRAWLQKVFWVGPQFQVPVRGLDAKGFLGWQP